MENDSGRLRAVELSPPGLWQLRAWDLAFTATPLDAQAMPPGAGDRDDDRAPRASYGKSRQHQRAAAARARYMGLRFVISRTIAG